jgi:hypothetical protein
MPKVEAFRVDGLDLWFNSSDHRPPHFHVELPAVWELRIFFLRDPSAMVEKKWGGDARRAELKKLLALAEAHRAELMAEWQRRVSVKVSGPER